MDTIYKEYTKNRRAYHDYSIIQIYEAGINLTGPEVKSVRASTISLTGSFVSIEDNQVFLKNCSIARPEHIGYIGEKHFDEYRPRVLLLRKSEIREIHKVVQERGITIIPLSVYQRYDTKYIKINIATVKGMKNYDKRNKLKQKTQELDIKRALKNY